MAAGGDEDWEQRVMKKLPALVRNLRPTLLMDHLRARGLIAAEEYRRLLAMQIEEDRSRELLHNYLPSKGRTAYSRFCDVLREVDGQEHILTEILQEKIRPMKRKLTPQQASRLGSRQTRSQSAKISKSAPADKRATFVFESEYEPIVKPKENALKKVCQNLFGTDPRDVKFVYGGSGIVEDGSPCHCDEVKLLSLVVYGVPADKVRRMRENLIDCVMVFLRKERVLVERENVEFLEAAESSAFVVLRMPFSVYFPLLCVFAEPGKEHTLGIQLQSLFSDLTKAVLRVGGLPSALLTDEHSAQTISTDLRASQTSEQKTTSDYDKSQSTTRMAGGYIVRQSGHHTRDFEILPPIAHDIAISQLPEEVRLSLSRSSDNNAAKNETCQRYLVDHFPDYFETDSNRLKLSQHQTGFISNLIQFLGVTVNSSVEDLYAVLHELRCKDACQILQRYITERRTSATQRQEQIIFDSTEKLPHAVTQRQEELTMVREGFDYLRSQWGEHSLHYMCITGQTASGKTELARQYVSWLMNRWRADEETDGKSHYLAVVLKSSSLEELELSLCYFCYQMEWDIVVETVGRINNTMRRISILLENIGHLFLHSKKWILVLDGLELNTWEAMSQLLPRSGSNSWGNGNILITTEKGLGDTRDKIRETEITSRLKHSDAVQLFISLSGVANKSFAEKISSLLDHHVAAIAGVAHYCRRFSEISSSQHINNVENEIMKAEEDRIYELPQVLQASLKLMLSAAVEADETFQSVLQLLSVTGPYLLPNRLLEEFAQQWRPKRFVATFLRFVQRKTFASDMENYPLFLQSLVSCGSKEANESISAISLHSSTRHVLNRIEENTNAPDRYRLWLTAVQSLVRCCDIADLLSGQNKRGQLRKLLVPHILHILSSSQYHATTATETVADAWLICAAGIETMGGPLRIGHWATVESKFEQQRNCIENALEIYGNLSGVIPAKVIECHLFLSDIYEELFQLELAKMHAQTAVELSRTGQRLLRPTNLARALKVLGRIHLDVGESDEAVKCLQESRKLYHQKGNTLQEASVTTLTARAYHDAGRNDVSQHLLEEAYAMLSKMKTTASDGTSLWIHSQILASLGRSYLEPDFTEASKAIEFLEKSLDIRLRMYGYEHAMTALSMTALGRAYLVNQQHLIAKAKLERALEIQDIVLHPCHPDKAMTMQVLGNVERRCENLFEAFRLLKQSLSMRQQIFGRSHHDTAFVETDLAVVLLQMSRTAEALQLLQNALESKRKRFGEHHIEMAIAYGCLRDAYQAMGDDTKAKQCKDLHSNIMLRLGNRTSHSL